MINFRRSAKLALTLTIVATCSLGGLSTANESSSAPPLAKEHQRITLSTGEDISPILPKDLKQSKTELSIETELQILKEKNTLIADFQSSLISIVIWSLSAVVSVVILLVGASLFTNFKMHEKDVQRIQIDYDAKIKIFRSEIDSSLAKAGQEIASAQEARSQQDLDRLLDQTAQVRSQFETFRLLLEGKLEQALSKTQICEDKLDNLEKSQVDLKTEIREAAVRIWELKEIPENILISSLQGIDAALETGEKRRIKAFIEKVKKVIVSGFIEKGVNLDEGLIQIIERRLVKLGVKYPEDTNDIRQLVAKCIYSDPSVS